MAKIKLWKLRVMIASEEAKRQAQKARVADSAARGLCCRAAHFGCTEPWPHAHGVDGTSLPVAVAPKRQAGRGEG